MKGGVKQFKYNTCYCSTMVSVFHLSHWRLFKYNTCYCSTRYLSEGKKSHPDSNTTPVTVQPEFACYCSPHNIIQIQYLLLFNIYFIHHRRIPPHIQIQYLLLFNETGIIYRNQAQADSNTILVTVQPSILIGSECGEVFKYNTCYCSTMEGLRWI